jgi:hypothetical protein
MKKYLLLPFLLLSFDESFCQGKKLLEEYKFRVNKYKALNVFFIAGGQQSNNSLNSIKNKGFQSNIGLGFFTIKSRDNFYQSSFSTLGSQLATHKSAVNNEEMKNSYYELSPKLEIKNRWYKKTIFLELSSSVNAYINSNKNKNLQTATTLINNNRKNIEAGITFGIGKGRIENIVDMQNALWLNKILQHEGNFIRKLTDEEILDLAKTLTNSNNFRVLDGRKRIQFILKKVDDYLQSKSLVSKTDIEYFGNLNDVLFFANNFVRQAGLIKFVRITPSVQSKNEKQEAFNLFPTSGLNDDNRTALDLKVGIEGHKPISLKHQIDYGVAAKASSGNFKYSFTDFSNGIITNEYSLTGNYIGLGVDYSFGYNFYPNTRTNVGINVQGNYNFTKGNITSDFVNAVYVKTSIDYFLSYNTKLTFNANLDFNQFSSFKNSNQVSNFNQLNSSFNTGINIAL